MNNHKNNTDANKPPKIVIIGGGSGASTVAGSLKSAGANISAVISMVDDGGSTGRLREQLDVQANSDVRRNLQALSNNEELVRLFSYRFGEGDVKGHTLGNLVMAAAEKITGGFDYAVDLMSEILRVEGKVIPAIQSKAQLVLESADRKIAGEHEIDAASYKPLEDKPQIYLEPETKLSELAADAIAKADMVVIAPGTLYTSLGGVIAATGCAEALDSCKAPVVYVCNLINVPGQTDGFYVQDYANEIHRMLNREALDYVFYNNDYDSVNLSNDDIYVKPDKDRMEAPYKMVGMPLISHEKKEKNPNDVLSYVRSEVLHDTSAIKEALLNLCETRQSDE